MQLILEILRYTVLHQSSSYASETVSLYTVSGPSQFKENIFAYSHSTRSFLNLYEALLYFFHVDISVSLLFFIHQWCLSLSVALAWKSRFYWDGQMKNMITVKLLLWFDRVEKHQRPSKGEIMKYNYFMSLGSDKTYCSTKNRSRYTYKHHL